jgi:small subunit ribosomal protein S5
MADGRPGGGRPERRESRAGEDLEEIVVKVKRCAKVVKGGKRFSFNALVVVGDRKGRVGWGYGKANEVPFAVNKGIQEGKKSLIHVPVVRTTIPHEIRTKHGATEVILRPACEGTGIKAGAAARAVLELAGVHNVLTKVFGSTNPINVVKATFGALQGLRTIRRVEEMRGVMLRAVKPAEPPPAAPVAEVKS